MSDNNNAVRQELRENNPFMSSASPLPWENTTPDLMQLNRSVSDEIEQLILHKRRNPLDPVSGLIIGEPGSGKTHMLTRILRNLRKHDKYSIFVTVKTFMNPESVIYNLLSEILVSLTQHHGSENKTQFDVLVNEIFESYRERMENDGFSSASISSSSTVRMHMSKAMPGIDKNVLKCLMLYRMTSDSNVKWQILEWLGSGLDDEDSHSLGLPVRDVSSMSDAKREEESAKILFSLGLLSAYAHVPMIVCFDQLDGMRNKDVIAAWGNVINLLMNDLSGVLPLCFVKFSIWSSILKPALDPSVIQRLELHTMRMKECSLNQAKLLIHDRIAEAFEKNNPEEKYNWLITRLENILKPGLSPRMVIELANKEIFKDDNDSKPIIAIAPTNTNEGNTGSKNKDESEIFRTIQNAYNEECSKIKKQPSTWPPNADYLTLALYTWLSAHEGFEVSLNKWGHMRLNGTYNGKNYAFFIVTPKVFTSAANALKKAIELLNTSPDTECFYISETKTHKRSWRKTNETLQEFINLGGHVYILDKDSRAEWYGLTALVNRIDNGDVDLLLTSGNRTATREDASEFLGSLNLIDVNFSGKSYSQAKSQTQTSKRRQKSVNSDTLGRSLLDIINDSPMKLISLKKAIESLSDMNIQISEQELAAFLKANTAVFKIFNAKNNEDVLIGLSNRE